MPAPRPSATADRLLSLDATRGLAIAGMILVNHPGDPDYVWAPLAHAAWNGWTPADLVFPSFLFIMGVAITLSFASRRARGARADVLIRQAVRRSVILFALGLALNAIPAFDVAHLRIPGILQRIAWCYLLATLVFVATDVTGQAVLVVLLLVGYWILMTRIPVPGSEPGAGLLEPESNLGAWVDRALLPGHLGRGSWDPEGPFGTISALSSTLIGVLAGHWLRGARSMGAKSAGLIVAGAAGVLFGTWLGRWFPVNKSLWTSSYAVLSGGVAAMILGACCWLVDVRGHRRLVLPLVIFGSNPIAVYVLATVAAKLLDAVTVAVGEGARLSLHALLYQRAFASWAGPTGGSFLFALTLVAVWLAPMALLYRRGLFIRI